MPWSRRRSLLALAALLSVCTSARSPRLAQPVVVPFEFRNDLALVRATVNGHPALLILDSGSGALVLDSAFARKAGVRITEGVNARASGRTPIQLGTTDSVGVGAAAITDVRTAVVDLAPVQSRVGYDVAGALGYDLFARYVVEVDYAARTVTLREPADFQYQGSGVRLPLRLVNNLPVVQASIVTRRSGTIPASLHIDLGSASYALRLSKRFLDAHPLDADTATVGAPLGAGVGGVDQGRLLRLPEVRIGPLVVGRPSTALSTAAAGVFGATAATDGTIGVPVWRRTRLTLDYSRAEAIVEPRQALDAPDSVDASGMSLTRPDRRDTAYVVDAVLAGSAADSAGVRVGDRLLTLDGRSVSSLSREEMRTLLRAAGQLRAATFDRGGQRRAVRLLLRPIV